MEKYKFLSHTADVKFQAFGNTIEKCFENAGHALGEVMYGKTKIKAVKKKNIEISERDDVVLLNNFLQEFLFLLDAENFVVSKIKIKKIEHIGKEFILKAELIGDNSKNYKISNSVKAITYNEIFVKNEDGKFVCQVVIDV
jgi:SHS2 domain-containing protein